MMGGGGMRGGDRVHALLPAVLVGKRKPILFSN